MISLQNWTREHFYEFVKATASEENLSFSEHEESIVKSSGVTGPLICTEPLTELRVSAMMPSITKALRLKVFNRLQSLMPKFDFKYYMKELLKELIQPAVGSTIDNRNYLNCNKDGQFRVFDREMAKQQLEKALQQNQMSILSNAEEKSFVVCSALGYVGSGKTTVGLRVASRLELSQKPVKYIFIDFSTGDKISSVNEQNAESVLKHFSLQLSMRVIARLFKGLPYDQAVLNYTSGPFKRFESSVEAVPMLAVLDYWQTENNAPSTPFIMHFDEINYLSQKQRTMLLDCIGDAFSYAKEKSITFLPLITGTTNSMEQVISLSKFAHMKLALPLLSHASQEELILNQSNLNVRALSNNEQFKLLMKTSLGVPRIVMQLQYAVKTAQLDDEEVDGAKIAHIAEQFQYWVSLTYNVSTWELSFGNRKSLLRLICLFMRGLQIDTSLHEPKVTVQIPGFEDQLECLPGSTRPLAVLYNEGYFCTKNATINGSQQKTIQFPYILLSALVGAVTKYSLGSLLPPIKEVARQELEELEPHFLQLLVNSFNAMSKGLVVEFGDIWIGSQANANILQMKLRIPAEFQIGKEAQQWVKVNAKNKYSSKGFPYVQCQGKPKISLHTTSGSFTACPGNPLFDIRTVFEIVHENKNEEILVTEQVTGTRKRRATSRSSAKKSQKVDRPQRLINLVQMKASSDPKKVIKASEIHAWYLTAQSLDVKGFQPVFTYWTNNNSIEWDKRSDNESDGAAWSIETLLSTCPNLVIMSRDQLNAYLSPTFAPLCRSLED